MEIKKGIPVSPGVAICPALVLDNRDARVPRRTVAPERLSEQHQRLQEAIDAAHQDLQELRDQVAEELGDEPAKIFGFHLGMLEDPSLIQRVRDTIDREQVTAEYAFSSVMTELGQSFLAQSSTVFQERVSDVWDLQRRVLRHMLADTEANLAGLDHEVILVAHELSPSETAALDKTKIRGMVTDLGGRTSHTAIVARAMGIPAVVGLAEATSAVNSGETLIVDGNRGLLIVDPDAEQLEEYRGYLERMRTFESALGELRDLPAVTQDGVEIDLLANIEFPHEIPDALARGAAGVGLYRTEFLFLSAEREPDEQEQYEAFVEAVNLCGGKPITIRTLDLGADKFTQQRISEPEPNPFLGCRSIRLCLQDLAMFKSHLRAILRASAHGRIKIMFPLFTNMMELRLARMILNDVMEDLEEERIEFDRDVQVGMMIEVPSAALMSRSFAQEVDFFSIGTNDLVQYTLAVDRSNERVASLYSPAHPAVLSLIKDVVRAAKRRNIDATICGEMAGEPEFVMLLLGMGLRRLSMTPAAVPEIKNLIRAVDIKQCERVARRAASYDSERQVVNYLREETNRMIPEAFDGRTIA